MRVFFCSFTIDGVEVVFPYQYIYPEQYEYMVLLKQGLDTQSKKNNTCMLEMPSGTGKTVTLLSFISGYQKAARERSRGAEFRQLFYCSRTIPEIEQAADEAKRVYEQRKERYGDGYTFLVIAMASRKNLCINEEVRYAEGKLVDSRCRDLTAPWVRRRREELHAMLDSEAADSGMCSVDIEDLGGKGGGCGGGGGCDYCEYYENFERGEVDLDINQVYTLKDLKAFGQYNTLQT